MTDLRLVVRKTDLWVRCDYVMLSRILNNLVSNSLRHTHEGGVLIGARRGSPLAVGYGDGEMYLGSDAIALAPFTGSIAYLEDGDWVVVRRSGS